MRKLVGLAVLGLVALVAGIGIFWWGGSIDKTVRFKVAEGESLAAVAGRLDQQGLIAGNATIFRGFAKLFGSGDPVQQGEFELPKGASAADILDILQHGRPVVRLVTITEGMPSIIVQEKLAAIPELIGPVDLPAEGSVLPNSYDWQAGETRAAVLKRMQAAMTKTLDKLWAERKGTCVSSAANAIILASIVEKETGKPAERRMVAGVYCNRLNVGMKLDADPTVIYPITKGKPLGRRILRSELNAVNGYNTYRMAGLPDGPIANPGKESIAAVLDPAPTKAVYFVADGTGGHVFAETLAQHNANVVKWRAIRAAKGI